MKSIYIVLSLFFTLNCFGYYQAEQGRWIRRDPIREKGGGNIYALLSNNSILSWDYSGLTPLPYTFVERFSYGKTDADFNSPQCVKEQGCDKWWLVGSTATIHSVRARSIGVYDVRGNDGLLYRATCHRLKSGMDATRAHKNGAPQPTPQTFYEEYDAGNCFSIVPHKL